MKEFERGQLNRDEAIHLLSSRRRKPEESPQTFAYKLMELVKLSYPTFAVASQKTIAKDYFIRGVHPEMQTALKSSTTFTTSDTNAIADETVRLELAGIKSYSNRNGPIREKSAEVMSINCNVISSVADDVIKRLQINPASSQPVDHPGVRTEHETHPESDVNFMGSYRGNYNRGNRGRRGQFRGMPTRTLNNQPRRCRSCQSPEHLIRNCPTRFCQACGNRGHDQTNTKCSNYQS